MVGQSNVLDILTLKHVHLLTAVFTVRLHVMQRTVLLSQFYLSVHLSVCPSDTCIVTKLNDALQIF